ncbi:MAG: hypothetical protein Q4G34_03815 [Micrococcus sp.]|nr:hypothetical protein [Micrococcus sp.]
METCTVHIVVDTVQTGIAIGGLRVRVGGSSIEAHDLAEAMTAKLALFGVLAGGAKVVVDPVLGSTFEVMLDDLAAVLGPYLKAGLLLGEDIGVTSDEVRELYDRTQFEPVQNTLKIVREHGVVVTAPAARLKDLLSSEFSGRLAGEAVVIALECLPASMTKDLDRVRVSVQGVGSVGGTAARILADRPRFSVVTVCDAYRLVRDDGGLPVDWLEGHLSEHGTILPDPALEEGAPTEWMDGEAHVLIAAAVQDAITSANVEEIASSVRCVVEAANLAVTPDAADALRRRGVMLIPSTVASAFTSVCFGLLATGEATMEDVRDVYAARVRNLLEGGQ